MGLACNALLGRRMMQQGSSLAHAGLCAGDLKLTMPTAFTVSMLAWGALAFPAGYQKAHQMPQLLNTVRWGADYLMKTWKPDTLTDRSVGYLIVYQVRPLHLCAHSLSFSASGEGMQGDANIWYRLRPLPVEIRADSSQTRGVGIRGRVVVSAA